MKQKAKEKACEHEDHNESEEHQDIDKNDPVQICLKCWHNARLEAQKRMFQMFDETSIFICACRHGIVLLMCDMIQSGEL